MSKDGENKNKSNILSMDKLKQKHEETFKMVENNVELEGENLSYKMYEKFPRSIRDEYIQEVTEANYELLNSDEEYENIQAVVTTITLILIIEKFTDISIPIDLDEKLIYAGYLSDFGLLSTIVNSFEEEELVVLLEETETILSQQAEKINEVIGEYEKENEDIDEMSAERLVEKELESKKNKK